jgi:hypothetical protein
VVGDVVLPQVHDAVEDVLDHTEGGVHEDGRGRIRPSPGSQSRHIPPKAGWD